MLMCYSYHYRPGRSCQRLVNESCPNLSGLLPPAGGKTPRKPESRRLFSNCGCCSCCKVIVKVIKLLLAHGKVKLQSEAAAVPDYYDHGGDGIKPASVSYSTADRLQSDQRPSGAGLEGSCKASAVEHQQSAEEEEEKFNQQSISESKFGLLQKPAEIRPAGPLFFTQGLRPQAHTTCTCISRLKAATRWSRCQHRTCRRRPR